MMNEQQEIVFHGSSSPVVAKELDRDVRPTIDADLPSAQNSLAAAYSSARCIDKSAG